MQQTFTIEGINCSSCKAIIEHSLKKLDDLNHLSVDLDQKVLRLESDQVVDAAYLESHLPEKYKLSSIPQQGVEKDVSPSQQLSKWRQLKPLFLIFCYLTAGSIGLQFNDWDSSAFMLDFMGLFYIVFAFFKFLDLKGFSQSFPMYDPLAKKVTFYAWLYPFVETALGISFLARIQVEWSLWLTLLILGTTTIGVIRVLLNKQQIRCACLGTVLQLPMTEATLIENLLMIGMALWMLIGV